MRIKAICTVVFFCFFVGGQVHARGQQQETSTPTPDEIMAAQAQANQAAAYRRTEQFEHQQLYEQQQQRLRQSGMQSQPGATDGIQPRDGRPHPRQKEPDWDPSRQNYDPMAGPGARKQSWSGAVDAATGHLNPCNNDYGGLLAQWHIALAQETIANLYFYLLVLETGGLFVLAVFLVEMRGERKRRLQIAGGVIAQLYNQYAHARSKAYEAIRAHNQLVEETEDRLDALVRDGAPNNEQTPSSPTPNITSTVPVNILNRQTTSTPSVRDPQQDEEHAATDANKTLSSSTIPIEALTKVKQSLPLTTSGYVGEFSSPEAEVPDASQSGDDISVEEELEAKRRQIETLQARLQNKTLRINELEDALAVSSNRNKIPEL